MKQTVISFALLVFAVLVLVQLARFSRYQSGPGQEVWITIFSLLFLGIGIFLSRKMTPDPATPTQSVEDPDTPPESFQPDQGQVEKLNLSKREIEVLLLINEGLSNQQIADRLFVSGNTIKKHISNLFLKMDVERRTEAVRKGKMMGLLP